MDILKKIFSSNQVTNNCKNCELAKRTYLEFVSNMLNNDKHYTSIVLSVGYVSYISLLSSSFSYLCNIGKWWWFSCIIFISISLGLFVGYEIWKIQRGVKYNKKICNEIYSVFNQEQAFNFTDLLLKIQEINSSQFNDIIKATKWIIYTSLITAFISVFLFFICLGLAFSNMS